LQYDTVWLSGSRRIDTNGKQLKLKNIEKGLNTINNEFPVFHVFLCMILLLKFANQSKIGAILLLAFYF